MQRTVALLTAALAAVPAGAAAESRDLYAVRPSVDVPLALGALAIYGTQYAFPDLITRRCPCDRTEVSRFERFALWQDSDAAAIASDVTVALAMVVPPVADALRLGLGPTLRDDVVIFAQTLAVNGALGVIVKSAVQRPVPLTYAGRQRYVETARGYRSFYSGHTSTIAAALTATAWTIRRRDGERVWPWIVAGVGTASVAVERVAAGRHFPTDVVAGAIAGFAVGTVVPWVHLRRRAGPVALVPWGSGAALVGRF